MRWHTDNRCFFHVPVRHKQSYGVVVMAGMWLFVTVERPMRKETKLSHNNTFIWTTESVIISGVSPVMISTELRVSAALERQTNGAPLSQTHRIRCKLHIKERSSSVATVSAAEFLRWLQVFFTAVDEMGPVKRWSKAPYPPLWAWHRRQQAGINKSLICSWIKRTQEADRLDYLCASSLG